MHQDFSQMTPGGITEKFDITNGDVPGSRIYTPRLTPAEQRAAAYIAEADLFWREALYYQSEAAGCTLLGKATESEIAVQKANANLIAYAAKKEEIRQRYPDDGCPSGEAISTNQKENAEDCYCLNASGVYHAPQCLYASDAGVWLSLREIAGVNSDARPCTRCNPPVFISVEE